MRYADIKYPDTANGTGIRVSLWLQGCSRHCKGCFNENTWDFEGGKQFDENAKSLLMNILAIPWVKGLSVLGGEPLEQKEELAELLKEIKSKFPNKDIWLWTGNNFEDVKDSYKCVLQHVDTLIDGEFDISKRNIALAFRGSENQRIISLRGMYD